MKVFEVFDSLKVPDSLRRSFEEVEVLKLEASRQSGGVTVHIESRRLLEYDRIRQLESALNEQFFLDMDKTATIAEHYKLSAQYKPEFIWAHYQDTIYEELRAKSRLYGSYLKSAEVAVSETEIHIRTEDTFINRHIGEEVKSCIEELFLSRFDVQIRVVCEFVQEEQEESESGKPGYEFYSREKLQSMGVMPAKSEEEDGEAQDKKADTPQNGEGEAVATADASKNAESKPSENNAKPADKKKEEKGGKADFKKFERKYTPKKELPDDPDIFYGKPFDGELSLISDVDDGFGDYVLRGMILKFEERELRNEKLLFMFQFTDFTNSIGAKIFVKKEDAGELRKKLKQGQFILL